LIVIIAMLAACIAADAQKRSRETIVLGEQIQSDSTKCSGRALKSYVIIPKGEWQVGATIAYMDLSADDAEFMLLVNGSDASASILRLAPNVAFSYANNQSLGLKFQYTSANCAVDKTTLDLLGNFSMDTGDLKARTRSYGGHLYNRSYLGLDSRGRVGLFMDAALGYTRSTTIAYVGDPTDSHSINNKFSLTFSPGAVYFPMNNVSCYVALCLADLSYNRSVGYSNGEITGQRNYFRAQTKLNLLALNFGLSIHL